MTDARPGEGEPDSAWATVAVPAPAAALWDLLADTALLFRLHPQLEIESWQREADAFRLAARHEASGARLATRLVRQDGEPEDGFSLDYDQGLRQQTVFRIRATAAGCELTITDRYQPLGGDDDPRRGEVDPALVPWALALRSHLLARRRWSWLPGWHWWAERFLPGMPPRQRRIVRLIVWVSILEFLAFAALVLIFRVLA